MIGIMGMEKYYPEEMLWIFQLFQNLSTLKIVTSILDLLIVWYVLYLLITVFKGTKAIQLLRDISNCYWSADKYDIELDCNI